MTARASIVAAVALAIVIGELASCGVSPDAQPRTLARTVNSQPKREPATTGATTAYLYFVLNGEIVAAARDVAERTPTRVLTALLDDLTREEQAAELISQVPRGTTLRSAVTSGATLTVDLSKEFDNLVGASRGQAAAQIVLTATDLVGIEQVTFLVEGKPSKVYSPTSGDTSQVSGCDYLSLLASGDDLRTAALPAQTVRHLTALRTALTSRCPESPTNRVSAAN